MTVKEFYEVVGGDYNDVLKRLPNDAFVIKFLKKYALASEVNDMVQAFENKDYKALFTISHSLKGMSANMSLTKIQRNISDICEAVRNGEPNIDLLPLINQAKEDHELLKKYVEEL